MPASPSTGPDGAGRFSPIAIVGRGCVLPGALSPEALGDAVVAGRDLLSTVPPGRWELDRGDVLCTPPGGGGGLPAYDGDHCWSDRGGYVQGFQRVWDPEGFAVPAAALAGLDPVFLWPLHAARQALAEVRRPEGTRGAVWLGNLGFPTVRMAQGAAASWLRRQAALPAGAADAAAPAPDARNRFMCGGPVALLAQAFGLEGGALALDAACASSLYALKLACDALHDGRCDLALAGAVQAADDLFIHVGFCALSAMSRTGRSRPFHAGADGLVPGEGAGILALKRLDDALRAGDTIHGVIRGVGLSNDGRGRSLLAPAVEGQVRAMRQAWSVAGLDPSTATLAECHATGTSLGDATELESMAAVFEGCEELPIGSLKSNLGHLITAAGVAGVIKVLEAMRRGVRPPTLHVDSENPALAGSPFRVLRRAEPWDGPRRATVSAFGFGGNNAHVILDQAPEPGAWRPQEPVPPDDIAVVAIGATVGSAGDAAAWANALAAGASLLTEGEGRIARSRQPLRGLRFPPRDLEHALGQQLVALQAAREAEARTTAPLPRDRTGVMIGMEADPEVARYGARWRLTAWARRWGADATWREAARDGVVDELDSAGVLGTMPNIPANRLNGQLDVAGPSFVLSAGEASGVLAVHQACRALRAGEQDACVVGAVDLSCNAAHSDAAASLLPEAWQVPGDAAVVVVLRRLADAQALGDQILAVIPGAPHADAELHLGLADGATPLTATHGHAHAAAGMVHLGAAVLALASGSRPDGGTTPAYSARVSIPGAPPLHLAAPPKPVTLTHWQPAGPHLDLPAHWADVQIPALPSAALASTSSPKPEPHVPRPPVAAAASAAAPATERMAPAPALPPVMAPPPVDLSPPLRGSTGNTPAAVDTAPVGPTASPPTVALDPAHPAARYHAQVATIQRAHAEYLALQADLHQRFLQVRQHALFSLLQTGGGALPGLPPVPAPAGPAVSAPPPVPRASPVATVPEPAPHTPTAPPRPVPAPPVSARPPAAATRAARPRDDGRVPPAPLAPADKHAPTGMTLDRQGLMVHASGNISEIYGPLFQPQDQWARVCRMPEPPLLLADRVTGLDAEPGSMGKGTIWTETDVQTDSWYLNEGRMPAGIMIESGQADLMLISYLGIDLLNKGERVYRLLGCQLTYHRDLPRPGETLQYDIHVDGHANHGPVRLFFFHYDCEIDGQPAISVRQGQAGFFTDAELADSAGILWTPQEQEIVEHPRLDAPEIACSRSTFSGAQIAAFAEGRADDCFGSGFEYAQTHNRPPAIQRGQMLFLHEVTELSHRGGPWGRGYLRAVQHLTDDDWFYQGHFKNDPCMPGTLMFEGCVQAMSFYLAAMGVTVHRDGWRFQPVLDEPFDLRCRGQAIPGNRELIYEVFVEEFVAGPVPTLYADLLCTIDGLKAFHARRVGLQLVPDWPITSMPHLWDAPVPPGAPADHADHPLASLDGFVFDYSSLLACAWGKPSDAFGPMYARFDGHRRVPRLPGPPYHFMSRVTRIEGPRPVTEVGGKLVPGAEIELEFDVDPAAWYFDENGAATMPFCVFLEAALQPCGWLASYVGSALTEDRDLSFRNLDGTATWDGELLRDAGTLKTRVKIIQISKTAGMIIEGFDVQCLVTDPDGTERTVYTMNTVFGFFPKEALENQVGLPTDDDQRAFLTADCDFALDLTTRPDRYCSGSARLATPMLCMLDRITGYWPHGGAAGLGRVRGDKDVDPSEWFFKAHFFQDPVQPGSLGLEALLQLLQWFMLHDGMDEGMQAPRFEPLMQGRELKWKYRGQVVPKNRVIQSTMEITERGTDEHGTYVIGTGSLWVDGKRIYEVEGMGMRLVDRPTPTEDDARARRDYAAVPAAASQPSTDTTPVPTGTQVDIHLDPATDTWIGDHRPTWTVPALPMMVLADMLARPVAAAGRTVVGLRDVKLSRWVTVEAPTSLRARVIDSEPGSARIELTEGEGRVATGTVLYGPRPAAPRPTGSFSGPRSEDPYAAGHLFHGPAFQLVRSLVQTDQGASATLQAPEGAHPVSVVHPALLDGATHPIPHDALHRWYDALGTDQVAYPAVLLAADFFSAPPDARASVRCEVRPAGDLGTPELPVFDIELSTVDGVWARLRLVEACFPKGPLGAAAPRERLAFLRDRQFVDGVRLSRVADDGSTRLRGEEVDATDWLPGTVQALYGTRDTAEIARREHLASRVGVHPAVVDQALPLNVIEVDVRERDGEQVVHDGGVERLDLSPVEDFWTDWFSMGDRWPAEDLYYGLMRRFIRRVVCTDPAAWRAVHGRPVLYLANHQVGVESLLFSILSGGLTEVPTVTVAKAEHRGTWLGRLIQHCFSWPGVVDPKVITYFQREDRASLVAIIAELAEGLVTPMQGKGGRTAPGQSVMVHVEGTRSLSCRNPVQKMSGAFIDMALQTGTPIVPVRFTGGLPAEPLDARIEFPVGLGSQDVWIGRPLQPEALSKLPYGERKKRVVAAINALGPDNSTEQPHEGDPLLEAAAAEWMEQTGATHEHAVLFRVLREQARLSDPTVALLDAIAHGVEVEGDDPEAAWLRELGSRLAGRG